MPASRATTVCYGLTLSTEQHDPRRLVDIAELAEAAGFDFGQIVDTFRAARDAGAHHDREGFCRLWNDELRAELA